MAKLLVISDLGNKYREADHSVAHSDPGILKNDLIDFYRYTIKGFQSSVDLDKSHLADNSKLKRRSLLSTLIALRAKQMNFDCLLM